MFLRPLQDLLVFGLCSYTKNSCENSVHATCATRLLCRADASAGASTAAASSMMLQFISWKGIGSAFKW